jgi:hypothetical protein
MYILFDHGTPRGISRALQGHIVKEARAQGWDTLSNGDLLKAAEEAGFEVLLTTDTNLPHQQNLKGRKLAIVILSKNRWSLYSPNAKDNQASGRLRKGKSPSGAAHWKLRQFAEWGSSDGWLGCLRQREPPSRAVAKSAGARLHLTS